VAGGDSNQVIFRNSQISTFHALQGHIPVASMALKMLFLVYAVALACVTSL